MNSTTVISKAVLDTNILVYAVDRHQGPKHAAAFDLLRAAKAARAPLALQCVNEFYRVVTSKKGTLSSVDAERLVKEFLSSFTIVSASPEDVLEAIRTHANHGVPYFDALLLATVTRAGCTLLLTEDLQDGRTINGLTIRNPFVPGFHIPF